MRQLWCRGALGAGRPGDRALGAGAGTEHKAGARLGSPHRADLRERRAPDCRHWRREASWDLTSGTRTRGTLGGGAWRRGPPWN